MNRERKKEEGERESLRAKTGKGDERKKRKKGISEEKTLANCSKSLPIVFPLERRPLLSAYHIGDVYEIASV